MTNGRVCLVRAECLINAEIRETDEYVCFHTLIYQRD